jgi:DnaJ-class molecular chaperone
MSIITKKIKSQKCYQCNGKGYIEKNQENPGLTALYETCNACNGTGQFEEYYSYYIDDKNKIAFDSEPGK